MQTRYSLLQAFAHLHQLLAVDAFTVLRTLGNLRPTLRCPRVAAGMNGHESP